MAHHWLNHNSNAYGSTSKNVLWGTRTYNRYVDGKKLTFTFEAVKGERARHNPDVVYTIDFKVTPHILRHTYITNLLLQGVDIKPSSILLGMNAQKSPPISMPTSHIIVLREIIEKINMALHRR